MKETACGKPIMMMHFCLNAKLGNETRMGEKPYKHIHIKKNDSSP